jgi:hypothetical protein
MCGALRPCGSHFQDNLSKDGIGLHKAVRIGSLLERKNSIDDRPYGTACEKRDEVVLERLRQLDLLFEGSRTEHAPADFGALRHDHGKIEVRA